jgi:hypothetical protein
MKLGRKDSRRKLEKKERGRKDEMRKEG